MVDRPDLDAIEARLKAATPGPWRVEVPDSCAVVMALDDIHPVAIGLVFDEDAALIAHAPADLTALLAYARGLEAERDRPCTCGSGGHPRRCEKHPGAYDAHCAELRAINEADRAAEAAVDAARTATEAALCRLLDARADQEDADHRPEGAALLREIVAEVRGPGRYGRSADWAPLEAERDALRADVDRETRARLAAVERCAHLEAVLAASPEAQARALADAIETIAALKRERSETVGRLNGVTAERDRARRDATTWREHALRASERAEAAEGESARRGEAYDRLERVLRCERGEWAPEGWTWDRGSRAWALYAAPRGGLPMGALLALVASTPDGWAWGAGDRAGGRARYALDGIEAATAALGAS